MMIFTPKINKNSELSLLKPNYLLPTNPFTILEPQNPPILELNDVDRSSKIVKGHVYATTQSLFYYLIFFSTAICYYLEIFLSEYNGGTEIPQKNRKKKFSP